MSRGLRLFLTGVFIAAWLLPAQADELDPDRDILVTFENHGARSTTVGAPYRARKRYTISAEARRQSTEIVNEYGLREVDHWPIRSLSVYCFVYRVPVGEDRATVIDQLRSDSRVESVQVLSEFETGSSPGPGYDDTYANLQHGLQTLNLEAAHQHSRGKGVRVAVIDSNADTRHEDLRGRIKSVEDLAPSGVLADRDHGTAVTSIIVARPNNARGIVGVAPDAQLSLYAACWSDPDTDTAVCNSFTLAKAIDALLERPPHVLNMSLAGPHDALLERLLRTAHRQGVILVAASPRGDKQPFPASMEEVIAVRSGSGYFPEDGAIFAPGEQILVAAPGDKYEFRSGSSLAAAHVSGVVALMLAVSPDEHATSVRSILEQSQASAGIDDPSLDACIALQLADPSLGCDSRQLVKTKL